MQVVFFAACELLGWAMVDRFSTRSAQLPLWARVGAAVLIVVAALAGAALITLAAAFVFGLAGLGG